MMRETMIGVSFITNETELDWFEMVYRRGREHQIWFNFPAAIIKYVNCSFRKRHNLQFPFHRNQIEQFWFPITHTHAHNPKTEIGSLQQWSAHFSSLLFIQCIQKNSNLWALNHVTPSNPEYNYLEIEKQEECSNFNCLSPMRVCSMMKQIDWPTKNLNENPEQAENKNTINRIQQRFVVLVVFKSLMLCG